MRDLNELNRWRVAIPTALADLWGVNPMGNATCGAFVMRSPVDPPKALRVLASNGSGWDHVSVSLVNRCPSWPEMEHVKRLFFLANEVAMQLHVAVADHVSHHPFTLHLWRPHGCAIPLPPVELV